MSNSTGFRIFTVAVFAALCCSPQSLASAGGGPMAYVGTGESLTQSGSLADGIIDSDHTADLIIANYDATMSVRIEAIIAGQLALPFSVVSDSCSGVTLVPWDTCTVSLKFHPDLEQTYSDTFDIPYTIDPLGAPVSRTIVYTLSGTGIKPVTQVIDTVGATDDQTIGFGNSALNVVNNSTITVKNAGSGVLELNAIGVSNPLAAPFSIPGATDFCSWNSLNPNDTCTFVVRFLPTATGSFSDTFSIGSNDPQNPAITFSVSGIGGVPDIDVTDPVTPATDLALDFGNVASGSGISDQVITVGNNGNAVLNLGTVGTGDGLAAPFSVVADTCSGAAVAVAGTCSITVRLAPVGLGAASDTFAIPAVNDPDEAVVTFALTGTGVTPPTLTVSDDQGLPNDLLVAFGDVTEGHTLSRTITITNTGALNLLLGAVGGGGLLTQPFSSVSDGCSSATLTPAASCTIVVQFAPLTTGSFSDTFSISSNDPAQSSVTFSVTGTGTPTPIPQLVFSEPTVGFSVNSLSFGTHVTGTKVTKTVRITNEGTAPLDMTGISAPINDTSFSFDATACLGLSLPPEGFCEIVVAFIASDSDAKLTLLLVSNDPDSPSLQLMFQGSGRKKPKASISVEDSSGEPLDGKADIGEVAVGSQTEVKVKIVNAGTEDLKLGKIAGSNPLMSPFAIAGNSCSDQSVAPGATCDIRVILKAERAGPVNDAFDIPSNDPEAENFSFQLNATISATPGNLSPGAPKLLAPADGSNVTGSEAATLIWEEGKDPDDDPVTYKVYMCLDRTFTACDGVDASTLLLPGRQEASRLDFPFVYYAGLVVALLLALLRWSPAWLPVGIRPVRVFACAAFTMAISMSCKSGLSAKYSGAGAESGGDESEKLVLELQVPPPIAPGTYFWKVTAVDSRGAWTESPVWSFTVE